MNVGDLVRCKGYYDGKLNQLAIIINTSELVHEQIYVFGYGYRRCGWSTWEVVNECR